MIAVTVEYRLVDEAWPLAIALLLVFLTSLAGGSPHAGIFRPDAVPVVEAIAEGEAAVGKPGVPLSRWRHVVSAPSGRPAVREVIVATPYYRVAREAYLRALRGERLAPEEASGLLKRLVRDYGPFPIGLLLTFSPAPQTLPHPQAVEVRDASGRRLAVKGFIRSGGAEAVSESIEVIVSAEGADLRWLDLTVPLDPPQRIRIDLRGVR